MSQTSKRLWALALSLCLLGGLWLPTGAAEEPSVTQVISGGITVAYTATDYVINSDAERALVYGGAGALGGFGTDYYRIADGRNTFTYRFSGQIGQMAYIVFDLFGEHRVEVSSDNRNWTEAFCYDKDGLFREVRALDLTPYFDLSTSVYVRFSDAVPQTGWGAQVRSLRYVRVTGPDGNLPACRDISADWTVGGKTVDAGQSVAAAAGRKMTFSKTVKPAEGWIGGDLALSFAWIESGSAPVVRVNGQPVKSVSYYGRNLTIPLPQGSNGQNVQVEVDVTGTADGKCGLWKSVRMGYQDMVTMMPSSWTLDGETRTIAHHYYKGGTSAADLVTLNALAGNAVSNLYDSRYGLISFNGMMRDAQLFYAHDTSRNLVALAMEELYSPVVHLETIEDLYRGVKAAMVPGGEYEMFLKIDARPKHLRTSPIDGKRLQMVTSQDVIEPFADVYVRPNGAAIDQITVADEDKDGGMKRTFSAGQASVTLDVAWPPCISDKPTTLAPTASGVDSYTVAFTAFQTLGRSPANYTLLTVGGKLLAASYDLAETAEIAPPAEGYVVLSKAESNYAHPMIITWDTAPRAIRLTRNDAGFIEVGLVYEAGAKPVISALPFESIDLDLGWADRVGQSIVANGTYGAGGYDPTYVCGSEGLGPGALAAAAYVLKKYGSPLANEAEQTAVQVNRAAYEAARDRGHKPVFYLDRIAGCLFLHLMGHHEFVEAAGFYGGLAMGGFQSDGATYYWYDGRHVLALQLVNEIVDLFSYSSAIDRYRSVMEYTDTAIAMPSRQASEKPIFFLYGADDLSYLGHMGDDEAFAHVLKASSASLDDSGIFACSDINPYFLGWSLKGVMNKTWDLADKKAVVKKGQSALYDADGNYTILDYPTAYINNPYLFRASSSDVTLGDINGDGAVNAADALLALQHSVKLTELTGNAAVAADVSGDDAINAADALLILQKSVKLIDTFPAE